MHASNYCRIIFRFISFHSISIILSPHTHIQTHTHAVSCFYIFPETLWGKITSEMMDLMIWQVICRITQSMFRFFSFHLCICFRNMDELCTPFFFLLSVASESFQLLHWQCVCMLFAIDFSENAFMKLNPCNAKHAERISNAKKSHSQNGKSH